MKTWLILAACVIVASVALLLLGSATGSLVTRMMMATTCKQQQGDRALISTIQRADGVECVYSAEGFGRSTNNRRAVK